MEYPRVFVRVKAVVFDSFIQIALIIIIGQLFSISNNIPSFIKASAFILVFIGYEPLLVSSVGGTLGHMIFGLRVLKSSDEQSKIPFYIALPRFLLKWLLGFISLFTVMSEKKGRAIHDLASNSIVIYKS